MTIKKKRVYQHRDYVPVADLSKTSEETKQKVIALYKEGKSQSFIEKDLKMTRKTIRTILKEKGIDRTKSQQWRLRWENELDDSVFDDITEESAYWIGFLYADGHIGKEEKTIQLGLKSDDFEHIDKFRRFLKTSKKAEIVNKGGFKNTEICRFRFGSDKIHARLQFFGFDNNKSYSAKPSEELKFNRNFWRGVIDGDGCVHLKNGKLAVHLCGTFETIQGFINFVINSGIETKAIPRKADGLELFQVVFEANKGRDVANLLYKDSKIYLNRKYIKYLENK